MGNCGWAFPFSAGIGEPELAIEADTPHARGNCTVKLAPWLGPALSARITPSCSSTTARAMASPRPRPTERDSALDPRCTNGSKIRSASPSSKPMPLSVTATQSCKSPLSFVVLNDRT